MGPQGRAPGRLGPRARGRRPYVVPVRPNGPRQEPAVPGKVVVVEGARVGRRRQVQGAPGARAVGRPPPGIRRRPRRVPCWAAPPDPGDLSRGTAPRAAPPRAPKHPGDPTRPAPGPPGSELPFRGRGNLSSRAPWATNRVLGGPARPSLSISAPARTVSSTARPGSALPLPRGLGAAIEPAHPPHPDPAPVSRSREPARGSPRALLRLAAL